MLSKRTRICVAIGLWCWGIIASQAGAQTPAGKTDGPAIKVTTHLVMLSVVVTLIALGVFGYVKGRFTGLAPLRSASQTVVIGALAAGAAFLLARIIS